MHHKRTPYPCCAVLLLCLLSFTICGVGSAQAATVFSVRPVQAATIFSVRPVQPATIFSIRPVQPATVFSIRPVQPIAAYGIDVIYDDNFWAQVELSIAMIRTSPGRICAGNCLGRSRGSKVKLTFPDGFRDLVLEQLGKKDVVNSYFVVHCQNGHLPGRQYIYFDFFSNVKSTTDGRSYFERSSNAGNIKGKRCFPLTYNYGSLQTFVEAPPTFILKGVVFKNAEGQSLILRPKEEPMATSTSELFYSCGGPFDTRPVIPWNDQNEIVLPSKFSAATTSEQ